MSLLNKPTSELCWTLSAALAIFFLATQCCFAVNPSEEVVAERKRKLAASADDRSNEPVRSDSTNGLFNVIAKLPVTYRDSLVRWDQIRTLVLNDGGVLIWQDSKKGALASIFDPSTNTFTSMGEHSPVFRFADKTVYIDYKFSKRHFQLAVNCFSNNPDLAYLLACGQMQVNLRKEYSAAMLPSGKILVAGGLVGKCTTKGSIDWQPTDSVDEYTPLTGQSVRVGALTQPRARSQAVLLSNGDVLIAGGVSSTSLSSPQLLSTDIYKTPKKICVKGPVLNTSLRTSCWHRLVDSSFPLICFTNEEFILFDAKSNAFTKLRNIVPNRGGYTITSVQGNRILVTGGKLNKAAEYDRAMPDVYSYDLRTKLAKRIGALVQARAHHGAVQLPNGRILVFGGDVVNQENSFLVPFTAITVPGSYKSKPLNTAEIGLVSKNK